ncbi:hypothetical protein A9R05_21320 [Burkholderia sp. KK1]|nr:hypothetical protein A9R05_21320 [Burkholderia sp. KK1]
MEDLSETPELEAMRLVRRARRRLVRKKKLLTATEFCLRGGISKTELRRRLKHETVFGIDIGRERRYPAIFLRADRLGSRLARVVRAMSGLDAWRKYFELTYRFESLGNRSLLQVMHRAVGFRAAMRYARALAGD